MDPILSMCYKKLQQNINRKNCAQIKGVKYIFPEDQNSQKTETAYSDLETTFTTQIQYTSVTPPVIMPEFFRN